MKMDKWVYSATANHLSYSLTVESISDGVFEIVPVIGEGEKANSTTNYQKSQCFTVDSIFDGVCNIVQSNNGGRVG